MFNGVYIYVFLNVCVCVAMLTDLWNRSIRSEIAVICKDYLWVI